MMNTTNTNNESVNVNVNINESNDDIDDIDIDDIDISFSQSSSSPSSSSSLWDDNSNDDDDDDDDDDDELLVSKPLLICPTVRDKKDDDTNMNIIHPHHIIPTTQNDADIVDDALAKEMASLTMIDHDKVTFDVHGLDRVPDDEEPSGVVELEIKFADFNNEIELLLRKISQSKKKKSRKKKTKNANNIDDIDATVTTMNNIMILHPTYYHDSVLKFLRSERYNTKAAARKMIKHFKYKQNIFCSNNNKNDSSNNDNHNNIMGRDVIQSDLSILDMKALKCGMIQILPIRDTAGRFILVARPELFFRLQQQQQQQQQQSIRSSTSGGDTADEILTDDNCSRAWFYFLDTLLKNDEFQKKGIVMIVYMVGLNMTNYSNHMNNNNSDNSTAVVRDNIQSRRQKSMPIKLNAIHICYNNNNIRPLIAMQKLYMLSKSHRERLRSHFGNHNEIIFKLQTYGIPVNNNHIQPNNNDLYQSESKSESESAMVSSPIAWHQNRLSMQRKPEDSKETVIKRKPPASASAATATAAAAAAAAAGGHGEEENSSTIVVGLNDVLFGKDRKSKQHPGNIKCNQLIVSYQNEYENVGKYGKTDIAERLITKIHNEDGGRFLKKEYRKNNCTNDKDNSNHNYCWKEVERNVAREKISHYFRRIRDNNSKKKKKINMNISQTTTTTTTPPVPLSSTSLLDNTTIITELSSTATATIATTTSSSSKRTTPCHQTSSTLLDGFDKREVDDDDDEKERKKERKKERISEGGRILKKNRR